METQRIKTVFHLSFPFTVVDERQTFDSILAYLKVEKTKAQKGYLDEQRINEIIRDLPVRKVPYDGDFLYATSRVGINNKYVPQKEILVKKMSYQRFADSVNHDTAIQLMQDDAIETRGRGPFQQVADIKLDITHTNTLTYICDVTDIDEFTDLIKDLRYISKKKSLGYGKVSHFTTEVTDEPIVRDIPIDMGETEAPHYQTRILPPYWGKGGQVTCGLGRL